MTEVICTYPSFVMTDYYSSGFKKVCKVMEKNITQSRGIELMGISDNGVGDKLTERVYHLKGNGEKWTMTVKKH